MSSTTTTQPPTPTPTPTPEQTQTQPQGRSVFTFINPKTVLIGLIICIGIYLAMSNKTTNMDVDMNIETEESGSSPNLFIIVLGISVIGILIYLASTYDISSFFTNNDSPTLNIDINHLTGTSNGTSTGTSSGTTTSTGTSGITNQVFNIPGNYYDYTSAKAVCQAYNAELATYDQVEAAYNSGGEWCNYGWSAGQLALFPTQKDTYNKLQQIKGHENDCGRPGVNGGYMANPQIKFGVNCYGVKPPINDMEKTMMDTQVQYPETMEDVIFQKKVNYWKNKINEILISPFNRTTWSKV